MAIAIPGELKGFETVHRLFGSKMSWESLFESTIKLCEKGAKVSERLEINLKNHEDMIKNDKLLRYNEKLRA